MLRKTNRHLNRIIICITLTLVALFGYSIQHASSPNSTSPGNVWAWGSNQSGQLGNNTFNQGPTPGFVEGVNGSTNPYLSGAINLAGGGAHTLALMSDNTITAIGQNGSGQLGITDISLRPLPVQVRDANNQVFTNATAVTAGNGHSMALRSDGTVWAWGLNNTGQLGTNACVDCGTQFPPPNPVPGQVRIHPRQGGEFITGIKAIDAGGFFSLALKTNGTVLSWGSNRHNELGNSAIIGTGGGQSDSGPGRCSDGYHGHRRRRR